jgi:predicted glycosyl hydrolase (DUF1957 family)
MAHTGTTYWANLLHFYQPFGQKQGIIDAIVAQCYRPVAEGILAEPKARVTINFTGVLLDQLAEYGHTDVIAMYAEAARRGQVEFVGSSKYHAILPLLPEAEALRQIQINDETNRKYLGDAYQPKGFFLPEEAWSPKLTAVLEKAGFEWVLLDELAYNGHVGQVDYQKTYKIAGSNLKALFREHALSATMMSAAPRDIDRFKQVARDALSGTRYIATAMDGETFGHHRKGHEQLLFDIFRDPDIPVITMSEVFERFRDEAVVQTVACTWASSEDDIEQGIQFISWSDPDNEIHRLQWELLNLTVEELGKLDRKDPGYMRLREQLDPALSSDPFFWAAARPWWMIEHIERGAYGLFDVLQHIPTTTPKTAARGLDLYHEIMALAYDWQRRGVIDDAYDERKTHVRIPFKEQFDYHAQKAILDLIADQEAQAAKRKDYEEAILWRNAAYSLEHKLDIYDTEYIIDILQTKLPEGQIADTIARYKSDYDHIRGGQVEQRSN